MKCESLHCKEKSIIIFQYENYKVSYCLEHLVERLDYIKEIKGFHIIDNIKKIIPIYSF